MRTRLLKPGFFANEELAALEPLARLLFEGLWGLSDREGRLEDRPRRIKMNVLPYDDCDVDELLGMLHGAEFIVRYRVDGHRYGYIQIVNFLKHQSPHYKEPASEIPEPDGVAAAVSDRSIRRALSSGDDQPIIDRSSGNDRPGIGQASGDHRPTVGQASGNDRPIIEPSSADHRATVVLSSANGTAMIEQPSTNGRAIMGQPSSDDRVNVDPSSGDDQPIIDRSSFNQIAPWTPLTGNQILLTGNRKQIPGGVGGSSTPADLRIDAIYEYFKLKIQPESRICPKEKIAARLKTFTVDELKQGIDRFAASHWWMGNNGQQGAKWFFNSDDRSEKFKNLKPDSDNGTTAASPKTTNGYVDDGRIPWGQNSWKPSDAELAEADAEIEAERVEAERLVAEKEQSDYDSSDNQDVADDFDELPPDTESEAAF